MSIPFVPDETTKAPGLYTPSQGLMRVVAGNASPFTYTGTGTYILHNDTHCAVIDPGPKSDAHLSNILKAVGTRTISAVLVTHTHRDHSPAAAPLKEKTGAPIWGCTPAKQPSSNDEARDPAIHLDESQDYSYAPDRILTEKDTLQFPFATLKPIETPGHLVNHLCFLWKERGALFSGDHIMGWATSVVIPPDGDMASYMDSLKKILTMDINSIWPTHGQPITEPKPFITALIDHRRAREASIVSEIKKGNGRIEDIVKTLYVDTPKALYPAAAQSVYSHIIDLLGRDVIKTQQSVGISAFYEA